MKPEQANGQARPRPWQLGLPLILACIGFIALGNWQLQRRSWKLDLIARVEARIHAPAVPAPTRSQWPTIEAAQDEYRKVCARGTLLNQQETLVQAVTRIGPGHWVLTPLRMEDGSYILINRGFVDEVHRDPASRAVAQTPSTTQVCGLLRLSEPHGAFLHRNDAAAGRWYSRDVAAITAGRGLPADNAAPYFIDADATANPAGWPVGGLTVVQFHNNHLSYALTWYALALMSAAATVALFRLESRRS